MSQMASRSAPPSGAQPAAPSQAPATPRKRVHWAWDAALALGALAFVPISAAAFPLMGYLGGRLGSEDCATWIVLAVLAACAVSLPVLVVRLVRSWRRLGWLGRGLGLALVALAVLPFVPSSPVRFSVLYHSLKAPMPDDRAAYLYGFRDRMRATADWEAIRQRAKEPHAQESHADSSEAEWPPSVRSLDPWQVTRYRDAVVLEWLKWYSCGFLTGPPTRVALVVFKEESGKLEPGPDAHRIAPGVWAAYWPAFDWEPPEAAASAEDVVSPRGAATKHRAHRSQRRAVRRAA